MQIKKWQKGTKIELTKNGEFKLVDKWGYVLWRTQSAVKGVTHPATLDNGNFVLESENEVELPSRWRWSEESEGWSGVERIKQHRLVDQEKCKESCKEDCFFKVAIYKDNVLEEDFLFHMEDELLEFLSVHLESLPFYHLYENMFFLHNMSSNKGGDDIY